MGDAVPLGGYTDHPGRCHDYLRTLSTSNTDTDKQENHSKGISDSTWTSATETQDSTASTIASEKDKPVNKPLQHTLQTGKTVTTLNTLRSN